jgi:hypothetical protein
VQLSTRYPHGSPVGGRIAAISGELVDNLIDRDLAETYGSSCPEGRP